MRIGRILFLLYAIFSISLTLLVTQKAFETVGSPYAGFLPYPNLYIGVFTHKTWVPETYSINVHDRILSIDGKAVANGEELTHMLQDKKNKKDQRAALTLLSNSQEKSIEVAL